MGPAALVILVWFALWGGISLALKRTIRKQQSRLGWSAVLALGVVLALVQGLDRLWVRPRWGDLTVVQGVSGRYWRGIERAQAEATVRLVKEASGADALSYVAIWREPEAVCVRVMAWSRGHYQRIVVPGLVQALHDRVFPAQEICVGFEGDSLVAWPAACTRTTLAEVCMHSAGAHDASDSTSG